MMSLAALLAVAVVGTLAVQHAQPAGREAPLPAPRSMSLARSAARTALARTETDAHGAPVARQQAVQESRRNTPSAGGPQDSNGNEVRDKAAPSNATPGVMGSRSKAADIAAQMREKTCRVPLFYLLDDVQLAERVPGLTVGGVQALRQNFEQEAGVGTLAPGDPAYADQWKQAELTLEKRMRLWYGWAAWGAYEHQLAMEAAQSQPQTP